MKSEEKSALKRESDAQEHTEEQRQIPRPENDAWSMGVGARLSVAIDEIGSQALAAHAAGVSVSTLQRYVRGDVAAPFKALAGLARKSGVSLDWLATGEGARKPAARAGGEEATEGRSMNQEDVRIFFGVVRAIDHLDAQLPEGLTESVKADIALRMRYALATMARDQDLLARLNLDDLIQLARLAHKLI